MKSHYREALAKLNHAQKLAVTTTEGPVLVIAGPGTGKTQLLSTRVAHILETTDALPQNILCLTFTESGALSMRDRLASLIGQAAYDVTISTYHAFGSNLIQRFPEFFAHTSELQAADDLAIDDILRHILRRLPFSNPLKFADIYLNDLKSLISDAKRALLTPDDLRAIAKTNLQYITAVNDVVRQTLQNLIRIDKKSLALFVSLQKELEKISSPLTTTVPLNKLLLEDLQTAIITATETGKTQSLTKWKNTWLAKDRQGKFVLEGSKANQKLLAAADIYEQYREQLQRRQLFDFDDMILEVVRALEDNDELRFNLQEQYLYILLDEFQDTNGAQFKLVELLTNNPASEGRPNVLAVGDDDQAIYTFQGAHYSHMLYFRELYEEVLVVALTENYRSNQKILQTARGVAEQIEERLHHHFPAIEKKLQARAANEQSSTVSRLEAKSDVAHYAWVARQIKQLIDQGIPASEIAVLAPQHKYLEPLVPFLRTSAIPLRYEKRENILDDIIVNQLLRLSELCELMRGDNQAPLNAFWPEILSYDFWQLPTELIWRLSWQANDQGKSWTDLMLANDQLRSIALFLIRLSQLAAFENVENLLDYLIGLTPLEIDSGQTFTSPFYRYYFGDDKTIQPEKGEFWDMLTNLTILRHRLNDYHAGNEKPLLLKDLLDFAQAHRAANIKIINTSPYLDADDAVQLMTAYKAKGLEFSAVFVIALNDEAWGASARTSTNRLPLPANLKHIRYGGANDDERLRLFYVAITRAKQQLFLVNYLSNYSGKQFSRLRYLNEAGDNSPLLPPEDQTIQLAEDGQSVPRTTELQAFWHTRHQANLDRPDLKRLLAPRLQQFQLSPTHVNCFLDLVNQGPLHFFLNNILRFPQAPSVASAYGNAIHEVLEWLHIYNLRQAKLPTETQVLDFFEKKIKQQRLSVQDTKLLLERGENALTTYLKSRSHTISPNSKVEFNFKNEGVFSNDCHFGGKIDKLIIDPVTRTITIVDFKTGPAYERWQHVPKLHRYKTQLYLYKYIVEQSHSFAGYRVTDAYLEFVEPDEEGQINELHLNLQEDEQARAVALAEAIWRLVQNLSLPDTSKYSLDLTGIQQFEADLLELI